MGHQNELQGDPKVALSKPGRALGVYNDLILETKNHIKSIKSWLWNRYDLYIDFFIKIGRLLLSKSMTFCQSSRARSRSEAFLENVCFVLRICPKIFSTCHPKSIKIHPRAIWKPHQKEMPILKGVWEEVARFSRVPREWILPGKGRDLGG